MTSSNVFDSPLISPKTREVIDRRLNEKPRRRPEYLSETEFHMLTELTEMLIPQSGETFFVDIAGEIDRTLQSNVGKGWRYSWLPADGPLYKNGLARLDQSALENDGHVFSELNFSQKDSLLTTLFSDATDRELQGFLQELLVLTAEVYYSHPLVQTLLTRDAFEDIRDLQFLAKASDEKT